MRVKLTPKQTEVLYYLSQACSNRQIAEKMNISIATVKLHLSVLYQKLDAHTRTKALIKAQALDIVPSKPPKKTSRHSQKRLNRRLRSDCVTRRYSRG